jgi:hypothetical protein
MLSQLTANEFGWGLPISLVSEVSDFLLSPRACSAIE